MSKSKLRNLIILTIVVFSFAIITIVSIFNQSNSKVVEGAVRNFPSFSSVDLVVGDKTITEQVMIGRGHQIVNVWATWCGVCRSEHSYLLSLSQQGVPVIGLNYRDDMRAAQQYLIDDGNPFSDVIFDPKGRLAIDLGVVGTPETYLVNNEGMIVKKHIGRLTELVWQKHFSSYFDEERSL
ncbi:DsbE family thiol:disulfide interchange protein [Vibrio lamellibrachiae]|uniref:DsbE family thiol:disulfide interchange protein n=1 Tax=Vibrio lamellibrachiae TaxID=2910253 RepID=UPI003D152DC0